MLCLPPCPLSISSDATACKAEEPGASPGGDSISLPIRNIVMKNRFGCDHGVEISKHRTDVSDETREVINRMFQSLTKFKFISKLNIILSSPPKEPRNRKYIGWRFNLPKLKGESL